ncbi:MAG TPA: NADP-dependent oxidoreductase [Steroidobacteraceae bacterium]|jgi:NADPH:quinone reductase-like Zn-dependent oxidoreductase
MRSHPLLVIALLAASANVAPGATMGDASMRAAVVSPGRVQVREVARPVAGSGQVLVQIRYAGVNPGDWKSAGGSPEDPTAAARPVTAFPIPGVDAAGVIAAVGAGVSGYKIGDAVIVWSQAHGTYAQYVAVPVHSIALKPAGLSFAEAAGVAHAALAAWNLLVDQAKVHAGQTLLVLGGAGGVGSAAVQIASNRGAHVIATASARNADYLKALGVQTVIDYNAHHFEDQLRNIDIALNTVDMDNAYRALAVLRRGGYLLSSVGLPAAAQCAARAVICAARTPAGMRADLVLKQLADWSRAGVFKINIDRTFELADVLQAWQYSQSGHTRGKCVIRISD